jgi:hypothetical protein
MAAGVVDLPSLISDCCLFLLVKIVKILIPVRPPQTLFPPLGWCELQGRAREEEEKGWREEGGGFGCGSTEATWRGG